MVKFVPIPGVIYKHDYVKIFRDVARGKLEGIPTYRELCKNDLFFLLYFGLEREDLNRPFLVEAIADVEVNCYDTLDLWAREHYKSTILTLGKPLQELCNNPNERICIFSHTRPIAKGFLRVIKTTLEDTPPLKLWFPDIFYTKPSAQAPKWSEDDGLIVKRSKRFNESSVEAWGLVDGQPTSKHFTIRIYDDCVTEKTVTGPEMIKKTVDAYELSQSLGTDGGRERICGTHYHYHDLYSTLKKKDTYFVRIKPATDDGTEHGKPVLLSQARLDELKRKQGKYVFSCQQLLKPTADANQNFKLSWIRHFETPPARMNKYLLGDPADEKKATSDWTTLAVIGIDEFKNYFLLDLIRDRLSLTERWDALHDIYLKHPDLKKVGYEKYGKDSDIAYFNEQMKSEGIYFNITALGGKVGKNDRILGLVPLFEHGRFYVPHRLIYKEKDLVKYFIDEEYAPFPFSSFDDVFDCIARIRDPQFGAKAPLPNKYPNQAYVADQHGASTINQGNSLGWMGG
jgi:phage terminase large subunit-like protein